MILHTYFALRFLKSYLTVFGGFFLLLFLIDIVEQLRRYGGKADIWGILWLTLLNIPPTLYTILPLIVMISSLMLFLGLARSSELVVTRAAGRSALISLTGPVVLLLGIGMATVAVFNPIVASTGKAYEAQTQILSQGAAHVQLSGDALWWRQADETGQTVIRARSTNHDGTLLFEASFLQYDQNNMPMARIIAQTAELRVDGWHLQTATRWPLLDGQNPENEKQHFDTLHLRSTLTAEEIRNSFGRPDSISVWELPNYIKRLQSAGFSARRYEVHLQNTLASPLFLVAMMLISAIFTLRHQRGGRTGIMVLWAVLLSFSLYFVRNLAQILGENGQIPVWLSAWSTPSAAAALAIGLLLHLEDG